MLCCLIWPFRSCFITRNDLFWNGIAKHFCHIYFTELSPPIRVVVGLARCRWNYIALDEPQKRFFFKGPSGDLDHLSSSVGEIFGFGTKFSLCTILLFSVGRDESVSFGHEKSAADPVTVKLLLMFTVISFYWGEISL